MIKYLTNIRCLLLWCHFAYIGTRGKRTDEEGVGLLRTKCKVTHIIHEKIFASLQPHKKMKLPAIIPGVMSLSTLFRQAP